MKRTALSILIFLAAIASTAAAETTDRAESVPDANPECMDRNGPDCLLQGATVPSRMAPPPTVIVIPPVEPPVIVPPAVVTVIAPGVPAQSAPLPQTTGAASPPVKVTPAPPAKGSAIIAPRAN